MAFLVLQIFRGCNTFDMAVTVFLTVRLCTRCAYKGVDLLWKQLDCDLDLGQVVHYEKFSLMCVVSLG